MAKEAAPLSIAELEQLLNERQGQLQVLLRRREGIVSEIGRLDAEIQDAMNPDAPIGRGMRRRRRPRNEAPLHVVVEGILVKNKKGLTLPDLEAKIRESGYTSTSRNFRNVIYQCLYRSKGIVHDEATGTYRVQR